MKKEFIEIVFDLAPVIFTVSVASSFLKGAKTAMEYFKALIASYVLGIPAALIVEYSIHDQMMKYAIVLSVGAFGICLFNGIFKIFKRFESDPAAAVKELKKLGKRND